MPNLVYGKNVQYVSDGKLYGRTNGILDAGILTPAVRYSGIVGTIKVGETVVLGDLVYPKDGATPYYMLADPTQAAIKGPANAIMLEGASVGNNALALFEGYLNVPAWLTTEKLCAKARGVFSGVNGILDNELMTMDDTIIGFDITTNDGVVAGSTDVIYSADGNTATVQAAMTMAILNAIFVANDSALRVETDWAANDLDFVAVNAGVAGNLLVTTEGLTASTWAAVTLLLGTDAGIVYCGDSGKTVCAANIPATTNDMVQVIGQAISPTELMFRPITDYDLSA